MHEKYILHGHEAVPEDDLLTWAHWLELANRVVKRTQVSEGIEVSTVFLGLNHSFGEGKPLIFETMIFGGVRDGYMVRYSTWDEASVGHDAIVKEFLQRCAYCGILRRADEVKCTYCGGKF